jgi:PQQ-like domain
MRKTARRRRRRAARAGSPIARRVLLAVVLLAVVLIPVPGLAAGGQSQQPACRGCRAQPATAQRWAAPLSGAWTVGGVAGGAAGTVPTTGQAYVAVGDGIAVLGNGLTLSAFALVNGAPLWRVTLAAPAGAAIISVRAWPGVVTAGILAANGRQRAEVVIDTATGRQLRRYKAAVFGGAVAASLASTVISGATGVTSYNNKTGRARWYRATGANMSWRVDGPTLYVAESVGGYLASSPVTALKVINLQSGAERTLGSPLGQPFSGTLAMATDGAVLFASTAGVTAYSGSTGYALWTMAAAVPEGVDPLANLIYLTSAGSTLTGVDPVTGAVKATVSGSTAAGSASMYVVRDGVALGLDSGSNGTAWGYGVAAGRVTWTSPVLPWPHYFSDLSGLGGSADVAADVVVVTACAKLAATSAPASPASSAKACADPELVAFTL